MLSTNDVNIGIIMFDTDTNVLSYWQTAYK